VWQHPELDRRVVVRPDGFVSFSLVGDIKATSLTPPQLASNITENLSKLLRDPKVTVIVAGFGSKNIFVLGEVDKPGVYQFRGGVNVLEAISLAGGWKNSAVLNSVMLVRRVFTDQPEGYRLNVYNIIKHGDFTQNMNLEPGDVVYVPKSFVANIGGFIENLRVTVGAYLTNSVKIID
jgi:polysaccharide export outer membrane protein